MEAPKTEQKRNKRTGGDIVFYAPQPRHVRNAIVKTHRIGRTERLRLWVARMSSTMLDSALLNQPNPCGRNKPMEIVILPALEDNFIYLIRTSDGVAVIDPGEAAPVTRALACAGASLTTILLTHGHRDHTGGVAALKHASGAVVYGPDGGGIPELDHAVREGDAINVGRVVFSVLDTPGHGAHDISFMLHHPARPDALFCGDTLFVSGCGRALAGNVAQLWNSLDRLRRLPDETEVYCGHDYAEENLRFALSVEPDDPVVKTRRDTVRADALKRRLSVPSTIGTERRANPFLRCTDAESFARLRAMKDRFG